MQGSLSDSDEGFVLRRQRIHAFVQLAQTSVGLGQALVVPRLEAPDENALQAIEPVPQGGFRGLRHVAQPGLQLLDP